MPSEKELKGLINGDGAMRLIWMVGLGISAFFFFMAFKNYNKTLRFFKIAKIIEIVSVGTYGAWMLIYHVIAVSTFPKYYHFTHFIDICAAAAYLVGSLLTVLGVVLSKKPLLLGQILMCIYVIVEFMVMQAVFLGEYSTTLLRVADIIMWTMCAICTGIGSFITYEVYKRLKNEAEIKKVESHSKEAFSDDAAIPPVREEETSDTEDNSQGTSFF